MLWSKNRRRNNLNRKSIVLKKTKRSFKKFLLVIPVLIIVIVGFIFNSSFIKIQNIELKQEYIDCANEQQIKQHINVLGLNIFLLDINVVSKDLSSKFKCIKNIDIAKKYPNTLQLHISGRVPILRVATLYEEHATMSASLDEVIQKIASPSAESSQSAKINAVLTNDFVIDQEGEIFAKWNNEDLPKILYLSDETLNLGKKLDKNLISSLRILFEKLKIFNVDFKEVKVYSHSNILITGNSTIVLNQKYDLTRQLASLQLILEEAKIKDEEILFLDLRFEKPVVRYVKKGK